MFFAGRFVLDLADFTALNGGTRQALIAQSGYSEEELQQPGTTVDYTCINALFGTLQRELQLPALGLTMGERMNLQATRFLDQMMSSCSTVQEAFECAIQFSKLISDAMLCTLELEGDFFKVNFELNPEWALQDDYAVSQNLDLALLCTKYALFRLTEQEYYPYAVHFFYPKPNKLQHHFAAFNCHLHFNQRVSAIVFHKHLLQQPSATAHSGLRAQLTAQAQSMLYELPDDPPVTLAVKRIVLQQLSPVVPSIEQIAEGLHTTPRTLQRQLKKENLTFTQIRDALRLKLAQKLLAQKEYSIEAIAYLLGYSEASAFVRAFKQWTGVSPGRY